MKNIYLIPTDQPSMLHKAFDEAFILSIFPTLTNGLYKSVPYFSYITSDEEIKQGDWYYSILSDMIFKAIEVKIDRIYFNRIHCSVPNKCKKIILTTDTNLIADGVQVIDDEFLEWFVKNPTCEFVDVFNDTYTVGEMSKLPLGTRNHKYKLIIPQEEPKQDLAYWKENAEEDYMKVPISVLRYITELEERMYSEEKAKEMEKQKNKLQAERMYSEEDMAEAFIACWKANVPDGIECKVSFNQWFEQFKKK
jgi:hypothetical protein